jgi:CDP-diacylglycerol--glycerol-3-phosphate 3-phosphatidyltransferase
MPSDSTQPGFWTPANIITVSRMFLIPPVMAFLVTDAEWAGWTAMVIFVVAAIGDLVDGYLARLYGQVSVVGAFLDPLADKLMVMAVMVMLIPLGRIPAWLVVLLLARELVITGLRGIASAEGIFISASAGGKYKTAYQMTGLSILMVHYKYAGIDAHTVGLWLMYLSAAVSLGSGWNYCFAFWKMSKLRKRGPAEEARPA